MGEFRVSINGLFFQQSSTSTQRRMGLLRVCCYVNVAESSPEVAMQSHVSNKRSIVKAVTYRGIIVILDFIVIYLLTGKVVTAATFMIVSNIYTTVAYFAHERVWARIAWGTDFDR